MSDAIHSTAHFHIPRTRQLRTLFRTSSQLVALFEGAIERRPGPDGPLNTVYFAIGRSLGLDTNNCILDRTPEGHLEIKASGKGRHRHLLEVTKILAAEGFTGEVRYTDVDSVDMRLRLADGIVHIGRVDLVYTETKAP